MSVKIDTKKLNEYGNDLVTLSNDLNNVTNELFKRLTSISTVSQEWIGKTSEEYERNASLEKEDYIELINEIYNLGKNYIKIAEAFDSAVKRNEYIK